MEAKPLATAGKGIAHFAQLLSGPGSDEEILRQYSFADGDRVLTEREARSFLAFIRKETQAK